MGIGAWTIVDQQCMNLYKLFYLLNISVHFTFHIFFCGRSYIISSMLSCSSVIRDALLSPNTGQSRQSRPKHQIRATYAFLHADAIQVKDDEHGVLSSHRSQNWFSSRICKVWWWLNDNWLRVKWKQVIYWNIFFLWKLFLIKFNTEVR